MAVAPSSLSRLHEVQAHSDQQRGVCEVFVPGRDGGRWISVGEMATSPMNNAVHCPPRAMVATPIGEVVYQPRRRRRADGTLQPWREVPDVVGVRRLEPPSEDRRIAARLDVEQALASADGLLALAPNCRARWINGRVTVIPHKGAISRFLTIEDAVDALALGLL